jgi:hypothetical protein
VANEDPGAYTPRDLLETIAKDLEFYRERQWRTFYYTLLVNGGIAWATQAWKPVPLAQRLMLVACVAGLTAMGVLLVQSHTPRIRHLKAGRDRLLARAGFEGVFPQSSGDRLTPCNLLAAAIAFAGIAVCVFILTVPGT